MEITINLQKPRECISRYALPIWGRVGFRMDFMWQKHPFGTTFDPKQCGKGSRPTAQTVAAATPDKHRRQEAPGVDFPLPYWMGVYIGYPPAPS